MLDRKTKHCYRIDYMIWWYKKVLLFRDAISKEYTLLCIALWYWWKYLQANGTNTMLTLLWMKQFADKLSWFSWKTTNGVRRLQALLKTIIVAHSLFWFVILVSFQNLTLGRWFWFIILWSSPFLYSYNATTKIVSQSSVFVDTKTSLVLILLLRISTCKELPN